MSSQAYTQQDILEAWKSFVARGIIPENKVRPIIARSWERCKNYGLDPWSTDFPRCVESLLKKKRNEYAATLALAAPIMKYLLTLLNCNISISDADGFIYELVTPLKSYPRTLGTYQNEETSGNGAITIVLKEHVPLTTDGYEHYRVIVQTYSNASAPIMIGNNFTGVLNAVTPFGPLPEKSLCMIIAAAKMLENLLTGKKIRNNDYQSIGFYKEILNCCPKAVVILDQDGTIVAVNEPMSNLFGNADDFSLIGKTMGDILAGKRDLSVLMAEGAQVEDNWEYQLKTRAAESQICHLLRKNQVTLPNGEMQTLLVFEPDSYGNKIPDRNHIVTPVINLKKSEAQSVDYIGRSPAWSKVNEIIQKTAPFPSNVLLQGETGTGKEVVARAIHRLSKRKGCFVALNCGAIPKELLQSELFGYEQGAFTGARAQGSIGKFEHAHEGTLLLDEISEMPLDMQVSLLRFIQERVITRINSNKPKKVDVRIIAASNKNMAELVRNGQFREDLYYRLNVIEINLPPLRERQSDIPLLADHFVAELSKEFNIQPKPLSQDVLHILTQYNWPGNVRELKNVVEKALVISEGMEITPEFLPAYILHAANTFSHYQAEEDKADTGERERIFRVLEKFGGNISKTAKELHIARNTLYRKIDKYQIALKTTAMERNRSN
jgi:transcriptional regulator with PAS, ATPase and Fis domain